MIRFILEVVVFQLLFLFVYDLFLKKETFFQWNRVYLLGTFVLSLVLPWIKIEALKTTVSQEAVYYPSFLFPLDGVQLNGNQVEESPFWQLLGVQEWLYLFGTVVMLIWLLFKLNHIMNLKNKGTVKHYPDFTKIVVHKSEVAFSFFRHVFLGDGIAKEKEPQILAHELVHIKQWHSADLLFFEFMRIAFWFNPLVYVYQNRIAELHEFIADARVVKENKKAQYQALLSEAFQTQNLSFVNQFFHRSLIKKRIVMLAREKSKTIFQLKYLLLVPVISGILVYTSCEAEKKDFDSEATPLNFKIGGENIPFAVVDDVPIFPGCENASDKKACFQEKMHLHIRKNFRYPLEAQEQGIQGRVSVLFVIDTDGSITDIRKRGPHELLEHEVVRIIERLPKMEPGLHKGKAVKVPFSLPIVFKLSGSENVTRASEGETTIIGYNNGQDNSAIDSEIKKFSQRDANWLPFASVDRAPIFPGCENITDSKSCFQEKMLDHIRKNFNYPQEAQEKGVQGRVAIMFAIDIDGNITNIQKRGPSPLLEAAAERIIKRLPKMEPAKKDGQSVEVIYSIPITFKLRADDKIKKEITLSMLDLVNSSDDHDFLPSNVILNNEIKSIIKKYNQLVVQRNRLLKNADETNPVIKSLDEELYLLKLEIRERSNIEIQKE